jgi:membrane-associated phospholipid phosphatase
MRRTASFTAVFVICLAAAPAHAQSVASLFTSLPADFAHLFTPPNGLIAAAGGAGALAVHPKDDEIAGKIYDSSGARHDFFPAGATIGNGVTQGAFALGTYVVGRVSRHPGITAAGADLVDAQIVNGVITQGLKVSTNRTRPSGGPHSFPSGHTSATFATAEVIREHYGWKWGAPLYGVGAYVSVSRMVDHKHWASDVIFGSAIGIVSARAASFSYRSRSVSVSPMAIPRGVAVVGVVH